MPKFKTSSARENLLRRVRRQRLKYITILPSLITILNGVCGFAAIFFTGKGAAAGETQFSYHRLQLPYFAMAGYMILLAMIADVLDGRLARMSKSTSSFGGQLDSLCDIISFGVAPAFLALSLMEHKIAEFTALNPLLESFLERFAWLTAAIYLSCAAIRLARFNVENEEDESAHMSFMGLPSPAAAGVIVSLVIFHQESLPDLVAKSHLAYVIFENTISYSMPFLLLATATLMVSRVRYQHLLNQYLRGKKPFAYLIRALLLLGLIIWSRQAALALIFCIFAVSGLAKWLYYRVIRRRSYPPLGVGVPSLTTTERSDTNIGDNI